MTLNILFRRAFSDIKHNLGTQTVTTLVVTLSLLIFVFFSFLYYNLERFVEHFSRELGIVIYLKKDISPERIPPLYDTLQKMEGVKSVSYVSPEEAYHRLETYLKDESIALDGVEPNFLPPSFELEIDRALFNLNKIKELSSTLATWPEVEKVQYGEEWLDRLEAFSHLIKMVVAVGGVLLLLSAVFVVASTIKLIVYARQEELEILRLVGATNSFIQGPFLIEAFLQGLIGSSLAVGIVYGMYIYTKPLLANSQLLRGLDYQFLPYTFWLPIIAVTTLACMIGTMFSMQRFLKL